MSIDSKIRTETHTLIRWSKEHSGRRGSFEQTALPEPVKKYFRFAALEQCARIDSVSTKFAGEFCLAKSRRWLPINGEDCYSVNIPGFVWFAEIKLNPLFWLTVKDSYMQNKGQVQAKAYSLFTVAADAGPGIDQGALSRWLSSAVLFPEALLPSENLSWQNIDEHSAGLRMVYEGIRIDTVVYFGNQGEIVRLATDRYCSETRSFEKWSAYYKSYTDFNGRKIPTEVGAIWHFAGNNFNYARFRFTAIEFEKIP